MTKEGSTKNANFMPPRVEGSCIMGLLSLLHHIVKTHFSCLLKGIDQTN